MQLPKLNEEKNLVKACWSVFKLQHRTGTDLSRVNALLAGMVQLVKCVNGEGNVSIADVQCQHE